MSEPHHGMVCHVRERGRNFPIIEGKNLVHFDQMDSLACQSNTGGPESEQKACKVF